MSLSASDIGFFYLQRTFAIHRSLVPPYLLILLTFVSLLPFFLSAATRQEELPVFLLTRRGTPCSFAPNFIAVLRRFSPHWHLRIDCTFTEILY